METLIVIEPARPALFIQTSTALPLFPNRTQMCSASNTESTAYHLFPFTTIGKLLLIALHFCLTKIKFPPLLYNFPFYLSGFHTGQIFFQIFIYRMGNGTGAVSAKGYCKYIPTMKPMRRVSSQSMLQNFTILV